MKFRVKEITPLEDLKLGKEIPCSDYAVQTERDFIQFEFFSEKEKELAPYLVYPGVYKARKNMTGFDLYKAEFNKEPLLENFLPAQDIEKFIYSFFNKLDIYREKLGDVNPRRGLLIGGPPGTGKTACINRISQDLIKDGKTLVLIWATDRIEASDIKDFMASFQYNEVERLVLIAEDLGGVEGENVSQISDSGLLTLLDDKQRVFKVPTMIIGTTNYLEQFPENITNRKGRFDHVYKFPFPNGDQRVSLLKFFDKKNEFKDEAINYIREKKFDGVLTPSHIFEALVRVWIYDSSLQDSLDSLLKDVQQYKKAFTSKRSNLGFYQDEE